jgi:hypothetical protein
MSCGRNSMSGPNSSEPLIDVAEFIEFCIGCWVAPEAALVELMKLR